MTLLDTIVAVNVEERLALLENGETFELTDLYDGDGDETADAAEARSAVGQHPSGRWVALDLGQFDQQRAN